MSVHAVYSLQIAIVRGVIVFVLCKMWLVSWVS